MNLSLTPLLPHHPANDENDEEIGEQGQEGQSDRNRLTIDGHATFYFRTINGNVEKGFEAMFIV